MALTPKTPPANTGNEPSKKERVADAEQEALLREVDEAVRTDTFEGFARKYGTAIVGGVVLLLAAFGGYLWWNSSQKAEREVVSEELIRGIDQVEGNANASETLATVEADGGPAQQAAAIMLRASAAQRQGNNAEAIKLFDQVAAMGDAPAALRDGATIRAVAAGYDTMQPSDVIQRLAPLAKPGNPWFASAAEMSAHAYLAQGKPNQAGPLLVAIAQDDTLPNTIRQRTRQLAGSLGFDAIDNVAEIVGPQGAAAPATAE